MLGVPESNPVLDDMLSPSGSGPDVTPYEYASVATTDCVYGTNVGTDVSTEGVVQIGRAAIVNVKALMENKVGATLQAFTVNRYVPVTVGVPINNPDGTSDSPEIGRAHV